VVSIDDSSHPLSLLVLAALAPVVVIRRLLHHRTVTTGTLLGAISVFLLIPIAFFCAFLSIDTMPATPFFGQAQPSTSFMYFSLSTVTTVGYGDLAAVTPFARLIAKAEAVSGQVYLVTFVAMLVGLRAQAWASGRREGRPADPAQGSPPR
jgi:carbon starvation protein CstA